MRKDLRISWAKVGAVALFTGVIVAPASMAMAQQASDVRVDLNLKDADMMVATNTLFQRTGVQFVIQPSSEPYQRVTLKLQSVTAEEAVKYICQAAGAYFKRDENGVYIISHSKPQVELPPLPPVVGKTPKIVKKLKVMKAGAKEVYQMLLYGMSYDSSRSIAELKRFASMGSEADRQRVFGSGGPTVLPGQSFQPVSASPNPVPARAVESGADIALPGAEKSGQLGGRGGGGEGGFGGQGGVGGQGGIGGQGGVGGQGGQGNTQLVGGQGLVGESIDFISYDPTDNSLVVRGNEDDINQLQTYINLFDVAPRQVEVKVEFITTTDTLTKDFGTEFLYQRGTMFAGTNPGSFVSSSDPVFFNYATGDVSMRLRTALSEGTGKVVSAPIVRTLNNQPALIESTITTYIFYNLQTVSNGTVITTPQIVPLTADTRLAVAPRINEDNTITMSLSPTVSNFVGFSVGPDGEQIPNESQQSINVVVRVKNGETIVLGGLNQKNESQSSNKIPVLSELPIIGQFFKTDSRTRSDSELLIFVTPTVIDDDTVGTTGP